MSRKREIVVIGASAGALDALSRVLPLLPASYRLPILITVHLPAGKSNLMIELLQAKCALPVREAEDKQPIEPGVIAFAPPDYHLLVESNGRLSLSVDEPVHFSRPAIDPLFESAADVYGEGTIGVILTGASEDGAAGLRAIEVARGLPLVQEPDTAEAETMPRAALARCIDPFVLRLEQIAATLVEVAPQ